MTILSPSPDRIDDETLRLIALAIHLEVNCEELDPSFHDARCIDWGDNTWWALTDEEANLRAHDIDEDRGMQIALYDGEEHAVYIRATNEWLYLYRTN